MYSIVGRCPDPEPFTFYLIIYLRVKGLAQGPNGGNSVVLGFEPPNYPAFKHLLLHLTAVNQETCFFPSLHLYKLLSHLLEGREPRKDRCDCLIKRFIFLPKCTKACCSIV